MEKIGNRNNKNEKTGKKGVDTESSLKWFEKNRGQKNRYIAHVKGI